MATLKTGLHSVVRVVYNNHVWRVCWIEFPNLGHNNTIANSIRWSADLAVHSLNPSGLECVFGPCTTCLCQDRKDTQVVHNYVVSLLDTHE
jgi:hypothetical protein